MISMWRQESMKQHACWRHFQKTLRTRFVYHSLLHNMLSFLQSCRTRMNSITVPLQLHWIDTFETELSCFHANYSDASGCDITIRVLQQKTFEMNHHNAKWVMNLSRLRIFLSFVHPKVFIIFSCTILSWIIRMVWSKTLTYFVSECLHNFSCTIVT